MVGSFLSYEEIMNRIEAKEEKHRSNLEWFKNRIRAKTGVL